MIKQFLFDGVEAAYYIGGCGRAVKRRVPERGHVECRVKPLTVGGCVMRNRRECNVRIYAGIPDSNGVKKPYAYVIGDSATARDLYRALRMDGFACDLIC